MLLPLLFIYLSGSTARPPRRAGVFRVMRTWSLEDVDCELGDGECDGSDEEATRTTTVRAIREEPPGPATAGRSAARAHRQRHRQRRHQHEKYPGLYARCERATNQDERSVNRATNQAFKAQMAEDGPSSDPPPVSIAPGISVCQAARHVGGRHRQRPRAAWRRLRASRSARRGRVNVD